MGLFSWLSGGFGRADRCKLEQAILSLQIIEQRTAIIMATQAEIAERLRALLAQNEKARAENAKLLQNLRDAINNQGQSTPEVDAALDALGASIQAEDDENPDSPSTT